MAAGLNPGPDSDSQDPYSLLGIRPDAGFEEVQGARDRVVAACGDDAIAKARVEAAYDAVLMARLRDRQSGRVSSEAVTASRIERQQGSTESLQSSTGPAALLTRLRSFSLPTPSLSGSGVMPDFQLVEGQGFTVRCLAGAAALLLLLVAPLTVEASRAFDHRCVFSQVNVAVATWFIGMDVVVIAGLSLGALLSTVMAPMSLPLSVEQWQALPALVVLLVGALFLA